MEIVFATNNKNKLEEIKNLLPKSIKVLTLEDLGYFDDIEETAKTLEGNAIIKANTITESFNLNCFADDTGLEITALNGEPGVYSARYAGDDRNNEKNMQKVLSKLEGKSDRSAQFRTSICLNIDGEQFIFNGICKGEILEKKQGDKGFGYDPIFKPNGFKTSFAEMSIDDKNKISHRGLAIQKLADFLKARI